MFRRKARQQRPQEPMREPRGVYIWEDLLTFRFLFLGNDPMYHRDMDTAALQRFRELRDELGQLIDPNYRVGSDLVRIYENYVALTLAATPLDVLKDIDRLIEQLLEVFGRFLGWPDVPILGRLQGLEEYSMLSRAHPGRWLLGGR